MTTHIPHLMMISMIGMTTFSGCNSDSQPVSQVELGTEETAAEHDPLDIPMTDEEIATLKQGVTSYADALAKIKSYRDTIREAVAAGDVHTSHRPLDELDVFLDHVTTVARESNVPKSQWENVNTSVQQLRELFSALHAQIDAGEPADYNAIADDVAGALEQLDSAQPES